MSTVHIISNWLEDEAFCGMIGRTEIMRTVFQRITLFAPARIPVLIEGETGVGKEMVVNALRACAGETGRYIALNCAAIPKDLVESELFGHERGAFTGAMRRHAGILAQVQGGMLFLDEISGLPLEAQAKLLRAIETGEYRPVGGERVQHSEFRLIAAANEDLAAAAAARRFRLDLFHRLGAARIRVPPLRERRDDIDLLAQAFLERFRSTHGGGRGPSHFTAGALRTLRFATWPGNVRELRHVVEAAAAVSRGTAVSEENVQEVMSGNGNGARASTHCMKLSETVRMAERNAIREALELANGNRDRAAELLGVSVATLYRRLAACPEVQI